MSKSERIDRRQIDQLAMQQVLDGRFQVDDQGRIISIRNGRAQAIGHVSNPRGNVGVNLGYQGHIYRVQGQRLAWAIHHREWPPADMSVLMINGNKHDFRRENLALVPRGKENTAKAAFRAEAQAVA